MYSKVLTVLTLLITHQVTAISTLYRYPGGSIRSSCACKQSAGATTIVGNVPTAETRPVADTTVANSGIQGVPAAAQGLPTAAVSALSSAGVSTPPNLVGVNGQVHIKTIGNIRIVIYVGIFVDIGITAVTRISTVTTIVTSAGAAGVAPIDGSSAAAMIAPLRSSSSMRFTNSSSSSVFLQAPCTPVAQTVTVYHNASVSTLFAAAQTLLALSTSPTMKNVAVATVLVTTQVTITLTHPPASTETEFIDPPVTFTVQSSSITSQSVGPVSTSTLTDATVTSTSITSTVTSTTATIVDVLTYCVREGTSCGFSGTSEIYFGVLDPVASTTSLVSALATDGAACTAAAFTSDPAPGIAKTCYLGAPVLMMKRELNVALTKRQAIAFPMNCPATTPTITVTSTLYPVVTVTPTSTVGIAIMPQANVTSQLSITAIALTTTDVYENTTTSIRTTATVTSTQTVIITVTAAAPTDYETALTTLSLTLTSVDISRTTSFILAPTPSCAGFFDALVTMPGGATGFLTSSGTSLLYTGDPLQAARFRYDSTDQSIALFGQVAGSPRFLSYDPASFDSNGCRNVILSAIKGDTQLQCTFTNRQFSCQKSTDVTPEVFSFSANTLQICPMSATSAFLQQGCLDGSNVNADYYAVQISGNGFPSPSYLTQTFNQYGEYGPTTSNIATALIVSLGAVNTDRTGGLINLAALGREATDSPYFGIVRRNNDYTGTLNDAGGYVVAVGLNNGGYSATNRINIANSGNEGEVIAESGIWQVGGVSGDAMRSLRYSWLNPDGSTEFQPYGIGRALQRDAYMFVDRGNFFGLTVTLVAVQ